MRLRKCSLFPCIHDTNFPGQRRNCQTSRKIDDCVRDGYAHGNFSKINDCKKKIKKEANQKLKQYKQGWGREGEI